MYVFLNWYDFNPPTAMNDIQNPLEGGGGRKY